VAGRLGLDRRAQRLLSATGIGRLSSSVPAGYRLAAFKSHEPLAKDTVSIVLPVYNEAKFVEFVLRSLVELELAIEHEIIVVESNSSDGSREIVSSFEGRPRVRVLYQDEPRGKGNAVREGLRIATGSILMIQDADFEYDFDDYDALLEPILQRHASFVLGSRSLGLDNWRIRRYPGAPVQGTLLNLAQLAFASTFNLLYQQRTTDINTMFKVFRRECIEGCTFNGDGFNFDIELVCKIVRNGHSPLEVPVNYHGRGFDEGKKIGFADAWPSYYQLFGCRFGQI
jgi:glycosyltransferase involved in cell wall biosynthesis